MTTQVIEQPKNQIQMMAERLSIDPAEMQEIVIKTIMPTRQQVTKEQFASFVAVANEYGLNPLTKEIYAFPSNGGIQPIVSIDGWLKLINSRPDLDGLVHEDNNDTDGNLISITCKIYIKGRSHPTTCTEYLNECQGTSQPWKKYPRRMLRHKATIQAARYAFGLSGIVDPDEAERIKASQPRPVGSGTTRQQPAPEPAQVQKVEVLPLTEDGEKELIMHHAAILDLASNIGDLKSAFTDAYRAAKAAGSDKAQAELKGFYDTKKTELEQPVIEAEPEQSDADWLADLKEAE